ncbi:hypothetical protein [Streptomyces gibsoniae]|uniref:Uncharacterized protein n=1 Tax=Streptomyces gibsoniae TaxID=3075529 RepID=A0ABU2U1G6_9ACTN|nr:hypothetical protein [Streptomyces sp. DSM 41699]MDT0467061.1 hypothetical protein [Streptomyces sp. DSM 41699]
MHATADPTTAAEQLLQRERDALVRAAEAFAAKPSYAAYKALIHHYDVCRGCAHDTAPCAQGRQLRRAWVAVRWS